MHLFLAWSGKASYEVASALYGWLPCVIQAVKPFMSTEDIEKGSRWYDELTKQLDETTYGLICITQDNYRRPWINFEAGIISKAMEKSNVSPFLFNVEPSEIEGPLQQFQSTVYRSDSPDEHVNREDFFKLVHGINDCLKPERQVTYEILRKEFDHWWPELNKSLQSVHCDTRTHTGYDWLYTTQDLADELAGIDEDMRCKCMWIITPDIYRNVLKGLKGALQKHYGDISYQFLVPEDSNLESNRQALCEAFFENYSGDPPVTGLPEDTFSSLAVTDYIIMHPTSSPVQVFLELPLAMEPVYWIKVTDKAAKGFEVRFKEYFTNRVGTAPTDTRKEVKD